MRRALIILFVLIFTLPLMALTVLAQEAQPGGQTPPLPFLTPQAPPTGGDGSSPTGGLPFLQGGQPPVQQPPVNAQPPVAQPPAAEQQPAAVEEPASVVEIAPVDQSVQIGIAVRTDLEILADAALGNRPQGWIGSIDINDPQFVLLARLDLELLAGTLLGANTRPPGWFGAVSSTPYAIARDIRHDLELLADATVGPRPVNWTGGTPLMRCDRTTQAVIQFLEMNNVFAFSVDPSAPDYCQQAANQASTFMEVNILSSPTANTSLVVQGLGNNTNNATVNTPYAAAFLDRSAAQRVGVIPQDTSIETVGRSPSQFSNMMLVRGDGFEVYVDFQFTSVTEDQFKDLPIIDDTAINPGCTAEWCRSS